MSDENSVHADNGKPRHELRVPLSMSKTYSAVSVDRRMANAVFREEPEDEEDEDQKEENEEEEEEEGEGYSE
jgi:hypothetical protein